MKELFDVMRQDASVQNIYDIYRKKNRDSFIYGLSGSQKAAVFAGAFAEDHRPLIIVTHSRELLSNWKEDIHTLLPNIKVREYPELDMLSVKATAKSIERQAARMEVLAALAQQEHMVVLATPAAVMQHGLSKQAFERFSISVSIGENLGRNPFLKQLAGLGYEAAPEVEGRGQFAARGGIIDVFPIQEEQPIRIEFFDDEVDSIRRFDLETRRSLHAMERVMILPLAESGAAGMSDTLFSHMDKEGVVLFDEPMRIREQILTMRKENPDFKGRSFSWEELLSSAKGNTVLYAALMLQKIHEAEPKELVSVSVQAVAPYQKQLELLREDVARYLTENRIVLILLGDTEKVIRFRELLAKDRIASLVKEVDEPLSKRHINVRKGTLLNGFELPSANLVVITEKDIFGRQKKRTAVKAAKGDRIAHFREIREGDHVVHVNHGIGKYMGVETLDVGGIKRDYLHIKYGGDDKLFLPTDQVGFLQKYIGSEGVAPRLHKMGGAEWGKAKARAKASVEDIADELIDLYAKRREEKGFAFTEDSTWQREFEDAFPYQETSDQLTAIEEIKQDMERPRPMDRLLCGDVGFGKTEVAIRAAYKAVLDHKQVAVLVPTTVLAQQHFQTFSSRFQEFGVEVDVISRFRTAKEQRSTIIRTEAGKVDVLIGTHAILNQKRIQFKNLGLLIVDEEQRFGVKQKEKIKQFATGVDVLTLSATPIPRTLHMSLVGARDMSIIETPPAERFPVQTYVMENNDAQIASAIRREMRRGGQVYFIYNRVDTIDRMRVRLENLVPEASIQTAHGQMPEELLERVMMDFYEGQYDILLATSIIENGLDVSNANTIIVYNADYFGLSQLYQMRGRVGRSNHMAFAYFVYQKDKVLSETAEKRLQALKEFAELGAGFKIAMRDLEIRGAGNLLGAEQHGHVASVGFEMYTKLLDEAITERKTGEKKAPEPPEPVVDMNVEAYIDADYIDDAMHKIEVYQRIAAIREPNEVKELLDELLDRFGDPTPPVMRLLEIARIRAYARRLGIRAIVEKPQFVELSFIEPVQIKPENILKCMELFGRGAKMLPPPTSLLRIRLASQYKKNITNFVTRLLLLLSGNANAFAQKAG
ncbi:transcription-repair coupling factor [Selenomonas sp. TAMA-11512]|uniref:transcription-repair coupling factor n=1 Tax=Selenomonas sp. TAMA-11512 TaxID=3095337 RepID=UPI003093B125|nr:transcription-repair coupling factor [Selenomonas sp. TAMA-11512]